MFASVMGCDMVIALGMVVSYSENAGETYTTALRIASGDINREVAPRVGRWFAWNFHADGISGLVESVRVRVQGGLYSVMEQ